MSLEAWREIIETLARENCEWNFVVLAAPTQELQPFRALNVAIFRNNADLLNLAAMIARFSALISVDTGSVHIADNLQIPTLGIYTRKMAKRWRGGTYGGKFLQLIMPNDKNEKRDKQAVLGFLRAGLGEMSANLTTISANPAQMRSAK